MDSPSEWQDSAVLQSFILWQVLQAYRCVKICSSPPESWSPGCVQTEKPAVANIWGTMVQSPPGVSRVASLWRQQLEALKDERDF